MSASKPALKQLQCPNCGTALSQYTPGAQTLVCPNCASYVAIGAGDPEVVGKTQRLQRPPVPVQIGKNLTIEGTQYMVLGRVLYMGWDDEDKWQWNEWLLGSDDGRMLWLSYDENGFGLFTKKRFREQFDARVSQSLSIEGQSVPIRERYPAKIVGAEGELTWRASEDDRLYMAEGARGGKKYSIQQTEEELEIYEGKTVSELEMAKFFGDQDWVKRLEARTRRAGNRRLIASLCILFAIAALSVGLMVSAIGESVTQLSVPLRPNNISTVSIDLTQPGRPALVDLRLSGDLPQDTFMDLDVSILAPDQTESFLFTKSFWHETGTDEDGFWRDIKSNGTGMFVPLESGSHKLMIEVGETTFNGDMSAQVSVKRNIWVAQWFVGYALIVGILGVFIFMSSPSAPK